MNSQTDNRPNLTVTHRLGGLITSLLLALTVMVPPSFAESMYRNSPPIDGATLVTLKDGNKVSLLTLWNRENSDRDKNRDISDEIADYDESILYLRYERRMLDAALVQVEAERAKDQAALVQVEAERAKDQAALVQIDALYALLDELFSERVPQTTPSEQYKSKTIIVTKVLSNSILTDKFTPDTISLLKGVELALSQGRDPFITMSAASKAKLKAMLK